jgi:gliding motility associated protien GldN
MKNILLICLVLFIASFAAKAAKFPPDTIKITQGNTIGSGGKDSLLIMDAPNPPLNNVWKKINNPNSKIVPYTYLRESDVMWSKRVWREVLLTEKMNLSLYYPIVPVRDRKSFAQVIIDAITKGYVLGKGEGKSDTMYLNAYFSADFLQIYNRKMFIQQFSGFDSLPIDRDGDLVIDTTIVVPRTFNTADIKKIRITEQWYFNKESSVMDVRTIGICLLKEKYTWSGIIKELVGVEEVCWIYFPEARALFSQAECYNTKNDGARLSFDDIFWKRLFNGYIVKYENAYDRPISDMGQDKGYLKGLDALLEGEKIKNEMIEMEHNLWEY